MPSAKCQKCCGTLFGEVAYDSYSRDPTLLVGLDESSCFNSEGVDDGEGFVFQEVPMVDGAILVRKFAISLPRDTVAITPADGGNIIVWQNDSDGLPVVKPINTDTRCGRPPVEMSAISTARSRN
ncbi:hypothetical protein AJ80_08290 [Polytolypa hystricis UAMH7299]|uniref:Uncharacterized protein n=1 Tax=Polytolypa hystricis (strain UAMH7299) TaxID=1447883 RepID=A0A2B7XAD5_POLH7|nr:hypothetical protein AJ80_08290 [Polytolypa hystricis UAMH7299]